MPINFGTDSPLAVQNLPSSFATAGVPIGWYNARRKLLVKLATSYLGDANSAVAVMSSQGVADTSIMIKLVFFWDTKTRPSGMATTALGKATVP